MEKGKYRQVDRVIDYKALFNSERGRRVLEDLCRNHYIFKPTYSTRTVDPDAALVREGERSVVLRIMQMMETDASNLFDMIERGKQEEKDYGYEYSTG